MKNVPNNCGINEKMMSEILRDIAIKKDGVSIHIYLLTNVIRTFSIYLDSLEMIFIKFIKI